MSHDKAELGLLYSSTYNGSVPKRTSLWRFLYGVIVCAFVISLFYTLPRDSKREPHWLHAVLSSGKENSACPQVPEYDPADALQGLRISRPSVREATEHLSRAVQIETVVGDHWEAPEKEPELWRKFALFAAYLERAFPKTHAAGGPVERETVHEHGLLYTWQGSDPSLKPLLILAHQDVVPVTNETLGSWRYPPFSGHVSLDTQTIWGRGSLDCKVWLISSISAVESLLASGFAPRRTVILSYGFDEEAEGVQGARHLGQFLLDRYGPDSVSFLTHSQPHTSIGFLSAIVKHLEDNPFELLIKEQSKPMLHMLQCLRDAPLMPPALRKALLELEWAEKTMDPAFVAARRASLPLRALMGPCARKTRLDSAHRKVLDAMSYSQKLMMATTQAADLISGGVKVNSLPDQAEAVVNHRIAPYASIGDIIQHYRDLFPPLAKQLGLSMVAFGEEVVPATNETVGQVVFSRYSDGIETVATTPFEGDDASTFRLLQSVIRQTWHLDEPRHELHEQGSAQGRNQARDPPTYKHPITVSPSTMLANTDSHWYLDITKNIFRFGPLSVHKDLAGIGLFNTIHTANEHVSIDSVVKSTDFYINIIVAANHEDVD
ncbi:Gly-Xaa carboxypeptidase [Malassezia sp. CBS 17886]|nr:Gly-Xaa carboxypeptidase [Malassezia sp. CBS 17886]